MNNDCMSICRWVTYLCNVRAEDGYYLDTPYRALFSDVPELTFFQLDVLDTFCHVSALPLKREHGISHAALKYNH